jgi:transposase
MKKISTVAIAGIQIFKDNQLTIGLDLGDRASHYGILNEAGEVILEQELPRTAKGIEPVFSKIPRSRIALETGTHSPWVSRQLAQLEHEVIVAHARNVRRIGESSRKDDRLDARTWARLARIDPALLSPVRHGSAQAQIQLTVIRARAALVSTRTALVNAARGLTKSSGARLRKCGTEQMNRETAKGLQPELREALDPLLAEIESLNERIAEYDRRIEQMAKEVYPEVARLKQIKGVGPLIALTYVLTLDNPYRFRRSRDVGCFVGLRPGRRNSGMSEPQLHISKEGDRYLRTLLVQGAHYIRGPFGQDRDLRRWGLKLSERGGKNAKKRAVVAVARKLAVLLHKLWVSKEVYEPLRNNQKQMAAVAYTVVERGLEQPSSTAEIR